MGSHDKCCNVCIESSAILSYICDLLEGKEIGDFAESFVEVRQVKDLISKNWQEKIYEIGRVCC